MMRVSVTGDAPRPAGDVGELDPSARAAATDPMAATTTEEEAEAAADELANGPASDSGVAAASGSHALYGRRMRLSILSILSVPVLFAFAPLELSMPFAVVALAAPLLTTCDCRRDSNRQQRSSSEHTAADANELHNHTHTLPDNTATADTTEVDDRRARTQHYSAGETVRLGQAAARSTTTKLSSSQFHSQLQPQPQPQPRPHSQARSRSHHSDHTAAAATSATSELSVVLAEERLVVRKERLITHKLLVRKVVSTEMVVLSVPVRRERLEVESVQLDTPIVLPDDADEQTALAASGYVTALPLHAKGGGDSAELGRKSLSGDRHNYAGVDATGRSLIELLLCEERPRVSMDVVPVSRVTVTRAAYNSSQLIQTDLRKEHIDYVAPPSTRANIVHQQHQQQHQQHEKREW